MQTLHQPAPCARRQAPTMNRYSLIRTLVMQGAQTDQKREVEENTPADEDIGAPVAASDLGDVLTYSLDTGNGAASFSIDRATGQLKTKEALDHEGKRLPTPLMVTATDPFGAIGHAQL